jgi:hypothetical protein
VISTMALRYQRTLGLASLLASFPLALSTLCAHAVTDEIQVYNADIAKVGQWTLQSHSNYAISGRKEGGCTDWGVHRTAVTPDTTTILPALILPISIIPKYDVRPLTPNRLNARLGGVPGGTLCIPPKTFPSVTT